MVDVFGTNSSARLEGLIAANAFLDTLVVETKSSRHSSSGGYRGWGSPQYSAPFASTQQSSSYTSIPVLPWRSPPYLQQPTCREQWDLLLELRNKIDGHYKAVKEFLDEEGCNALSDWLDGYPTPSQMREVGLLTLRDIDQGKPPASIGESFMAALVQYSVFDIRRKRACTASSSAFTEWGHILFSDVVWEQLSPVYERLSSGYTSNNSPSVRKSPKPSPSMSDPSEHLGTGAQFDDQLGERIGPLAPPQLSLTPFDMAPYDTISLPMDPSYQEQASGRDHGLMPFHATPLSTPFNQIPPFFAPPPAAPSFPPLMELSQQISFCPALLDMANNTRGAQPQPAGLEGAHSDRLCYQLKGSQAWKTIMTYLDSKTDAD
ncbi:hypothetical protein DL765_006753 [Monosporascus sp. GIB2]|nr:hypothetical protein DL765_006753 [Monosporascus sp. GIB2]